MRTALATVLFAFFCTFAHAAEGNVSLYKEFYYGMSKGDVKKASNASPCKEIELQGNLCRYGHTFANTKWDQVFFIENEKLSHVALVSKFSQQAYTSAMGAITNNDFSLVSLRTKNEGFDLISEYGKKPKDAVTAELTRFENVALSNGYLDYIFLNNDAITSTMPGKSAEDVVSRAPKSLREVDILVANNLGGDWITVKFFAPKMAQQHLLNDISKSKDSF